MAISNQERVGERVDYAAHWTTRQRPTLSDPVAFCENRGLSPIVSTALGLERVPHGATY